jgi:hypothetical protein
MNGMAVTSAGTPGRTQKRDNAKSALRCFFDSPKGQGEVWSGY